MREPSFPDPHPARVLRRGDGLGDVRLERRRHPDSNGDYFWERVRHQPESALDGMSRARKVLGEIGGPSEELQSRIRAAVPAGLEPRYERRMLAASCELTWRAVIRSGRGEITRDIGVPADFDPARSDELWKQAFTDLGFPL